MREMKDSGVEWIGEIPANWKIIRLKGLFDFGKGLPITKENLIEMGIPVISYGQIHAKFNNGVNIDDRLFRFVSNSYLQTNSNALVNFGDILIADTSEDLEGCGNAVQIDRDTTIFAGYHTIILQSKRKRDNKYLAYEMLTDMWRSQLRSRATGVKLFSISRKMLGECIYIYPPIEDQQKIAAHLDRKCTQIDALISNAQQQIEKLKAYKQSVITETVTKGLDPDVKMKDSGVEWIGEIPEHWEVIRLKFLLQYIIDCPHETPNYSFDGEYYVIRTADEDYGFLRADEQMYRLDEKEYKHRIRRLSLDKDDIVYGREGERWGLACIVPESNKYCLGQRMMQFRCNEHIVPMFIMWALNSKNIYVQGCFDTLGSTSPHVNISTIINYEIPIPSYEEQNKLASFLEEKCSRIDKLIALKQQKIEKLQQYKKSLIYEYVTGKKEV